MKAPVGALGSSRARPHPTMLANIIAELRTFLQCDDKQWREMLRAAGISGDDAIEPDTLVPLEQGLRLFDEASKATGRPLLGIEFAKESVLGITGSVGFALVSARTVRDALITLARFMPLTAGTQFSNYVERDGVGGIEWKYPVHNSVPRLQYATWGTATVIERLKPALPLGCLPVLAQFDDTAPRSVDGFRAALGENVCFEADRNIVAFDASVLARPMPSSNEHLHALMTKLATIEKNSRGISTSMLEEDVKRALQALIKNGQPKLDDVAKALVLSVARLRNELKTHNLDFRALLDDVRKTMALSYLKETDLSMTEITFALGYADCSVFTRACNKWFGASPRQVRLKAA